MEIGVLLLRGDDDDVFRPSKKRQRLESVVPAVPVKPENATKAPPLTASWLSGRLTEP